jgi:hypothetical protein
MFDEYIDAEKGEAFDEFIEELRVISQEFITKEVTNTFTFRCISSDVL